MSTDRELLELAAKAAGMALYAGDAWRHTAMGTGLLLANGRWIWNPLHHDGDALRLAVILKIQVWHRPSGVEGIHKGSVLTRPETEPLTPDPYAATRRAIVRAAAEIGKAMP